MLVPHHLNHRTRGYLYYARSPSPPPPSYLRYWLPLAMTKNIQFSGLSREIFPRLMPPPSPPPLPKSMGIRMRPPRAFEWGGGRNPRHISLSKDIKIRFDIKKAPEFSVYLTIVSSYYQSLPIVLPDLATINILFCAWYSLKG